MDYVCAREIGGVKEPFAARYGVFEESYTKIDRNKVPGYIREVEDSEIRQKVESRLKFFISLAQKFNNYVFFCSVSEFLSK